MAGVKRLQSIVGTLGGLLFAAQCEAGDDPPAPVWPGRFHAELYQIRTGDQGITDLWYDYAAGRNLNIIQTQSGEEDGPLFDNERSNGTGYYYLPAKAKAKYCDIIDFGDVGLIKPDWLAGATYLGEETSGIYDCYKWEQGEIPEAHLKFLGLRPEKRSPPPASDRDAIHRFQHPELGDLPVSGDLPGDEDVETWSQHQTPMASSRGRGATASEGRFITYWSEKGTDRPVKWVFFDDAQFEVIRFDPGATMKDEMFQLPDYCFSDGLMGEDISGETLGQAS